MDATAWVAIAGIAGTLIAPLLAERMRRKSARQEAVLGHQLVVYGDLLRATARLADNARTWAALPLADLTETEDEELDRLISQVRAVAGKQVYKELRELMTVIHRFNRMLDQTATYHRRLRDGGAVDDSTSITQRVALGDVADEITKRCEALEETIRRDLGG